MFAQMNHVTVKALRFYEEQGLLAPAYVDEENGYRYYTLDQMVVIHQITALKQAGFTLEDVRSINSGNDEEMLLQKKKSQLLAKIAELTHQIAIIDTYLSDKDSRLSAPVLIKQLPATIVAVMQDKLDSYDDFPRTYAMVLKYIEDNGYTICGNIRESYIDGVWNKDSVEEWLTEIQVPVKKVE